MSTKVATNWQTRAGMIVSGLVTLALLGSGIAKISGAPAMVDGLVHAGIPQAAILPIAILELSCLVLYLIPRTTVLGTLLLTGYFGGAAVTHIIGRENFVPPLAIGLMIWIGAWLRIPAFRDLIPLSASQARLEIRETAGDQRHSLGGRGQGGHGKRLVQGNQP
jgi:hypothetical protein